VFFKLAKAFVTSGMTKLQCIFLITSIAVLNSIAISQTIGDHQLKRRPVKIINFEQGLLNNETTGVATDATGFTWIATRTGLQRFNGYTLDNIDPVVNGDTIAINTPVYLFSLQNGNIWISYENGVLAYDPSGRSFKKIISLPGPESSFFSIVPLLETKEGIWCMERNKGIVIYSNNKMIPVNNKAVNAISINSIINSEDLISSTIIAINKRDIFIRSSTKLILQINTDTHEFKYFENDENIIGIGCSKENLFFTTQTSLFEINIQDHQQVKKHSLNKMFKGILSFSCIQQEANGNLMVSLNGYVYDFDGNISHKNEFYTLNEDPLIPNGYVHHIYMDVFRRIWLLTNNDVRIMQNFNIPFHYYVYKKEVSNFVRSIYVDKQTNQVLAGCIDAQEGSSGGIQVYDSTGNAVSTKSIKTDRLVNVGNIIQLTNGKYLVTTSDGQGWYLLRLPGKQITKINLPANGQTVEKVNATVWPNNLQRINDSTIFIASSLNIFRCVFKEATLVSVQSILPFYGSAANILNCFIYTSDKSLWVGTNSGVVYIFRKDKSMKKLNIPGNYIIRCFAEDSLRHIWIGTDKGLYVYSGSSELIKTVTTQAGLLNDYIYALLPVKKYAAVFASNKLGLSYVSLSDSIKNYTKELGLQENEFNTQSAFETPDGKCYFGGINGITAFYPSDLSDVKDTPVLNITRLTINGSRSDFSPHLWSHDTIILRYDQNTLQFDIAAFGLLNTDEYTYHYRLRTLEDKWQTTNKPTDIRYVLPPGNYLLEMWCTPIFSPDHIFKKSVVIIISPPWWQTLWFKILVIACLMGIVACLVRLYLKRHYQEKLATLQLQHEIQNERDRISRDLHDNIGSQLSFISSNIDWVIDKNNDLDKEEELRQMKAINVTAKSVMTNLRETIWALHKEEITLQEFSDKLKAYVQNILQLQPGLEFISEEKITRNFVLTPTEMLNIFRICQECINNILKHSKATLLKIMVYSDSKSFHIVMEDNGKGFNSAQMTDGHYGLINMKHRADELKAKLTIISIEGQGTKIEIHK
jgi:two-component sensor histidine kinase